MPIRAVIFDLGGVLLRTEDRGPRERLAARLGLDYAGLSRLIFDNESAIQATLGKVSEKDHWDEIRSQLGISPEEIRTVEAEFWAGDRMDEELVEYSRSLRPQVKTGLLSNAWDGLRSLIQNRWRIAGAFDDILISAEVGLAKPDPRIYHLAVQRLGVVLQEAVFVDDFAHNVEAAQREGLHAVHFQNAGQARSDVEKLLQR